MPPQMNCPACGSDMRSRSLLADSILKPYRVCPDCSAKYTSDSKFKRRQVPIIVLTLITLGLFIGVPLRGSALLLPAFVSLIVLWVYVGHAVSKVTYVRYHDGFGDSRRVNHLGNRSEKGTHTVGPMDPGPQVERMSRRPRGFTRACRLICSALVACPLIYMSFVANGSAYHFLALVLLAPVAGLVLVVNSLFCLFRYRNVESSWISLVFTLVGVIGVLEAWYFLPHFRM